jgi:hypothetical protein
MTTLTSTITSSVTSLSRITEQLIKQPPYQDGYTTPAGKFASQGQRIIPYDYVEGCSQISWGIHEDRLARGKQPG